MTIVFLQRVHQAFSNPGEQQSEEKKYQEKKYQEQNIKSINT